MSSGSGGVKRPMKKMAHVGPNMTPMVDVVMCILIFFMLGSSFLMPELFLQSTMPAIDKAGLGTVETSQKMPSVRNFIKLVRKDNTETWVYAFNLNPMKMDKIDDINQDHNQDIMQNFEGMQQKSSPDMQIIIQPQGIIPYQDVITIYDFCVKAKFKQVAFAPAN